LRFIQSYNARPAIIKAPHHGSDDSGWEWLWVLRPRLVISQASATDKKVAGDRMKDWLMTAGVPSVTTGEDGALEWCTNGSEFYAGTYVSGRCWECKLNTLACGSIGRLIRTYRAI
jgi:hypothetical protein